LILLITDWSGIEDLITDGFLKQKNPFFDFVLGVFDLDVCGLNIY